MVKHHILELFKSYLVAVVDIVLSHDLIDLLVGEVVAHLGESLAEGHRAQLVRLLRVELLEQRLKPLLVCVLVHVERRCYKIVVIDDPVTLQIDFIYYSF